MEKDYQHLTFEYLRSPDQDAGKPVRRPVVVIGAGPVGLASAIDLALQGVPVVLLDDEASLSVGSRAICFAKRTLEIFDRIGCGQRVAQKGLSWNVGKVFYRDDMVYSFDLLPEAGHAMPAFVNLQQYYVEGYLLERALELAHFEVRWRNKVVGVAQEGDHVALTIDTPGGSYTLECDYLVAADGARSAVRSLLGLESTGRTFQDRFLIADVRMKADFPTERWFWFDPPFHPNQSVLLHRQPDNVWRVDFQLGWDADPVAEKQPEKVIPRIQALLGPGVEFELEWVSVYTFACVRMESFRHGRVFFTGDAAHRVSPFGARGANSGVQDGENLAWKLRLVLAGQAPDALLDSYAQERQYAADENLLNSTRSTDFITPKSAVSRSFRDAALRLSKDHEFARRLVNSGRLSTAATLSGSALNTPDADPFKGGLVPGTPIHDAPVASAAGEPGWFSACVGNEFTGVYFDDPAAPDAPAWMHACDSGAIRVRQLVVVRSAERVRGFEGMTVIADPEGLLAQRYDARPGTYYLFRPDQHVCARWRSLDPARVRAALARATGNVV